MCALSVVYASHLLKPHSVSPKALHLPLVPHSVFPNTSRFPIIIRSTQFFAAVGLGHVDEDRFHEERKASDQPYWWKPLPSAHVGPCSTECGGRGYCAWFRCLFAYLDWVGIFSSFGKALSRKAILLSSLVCNWFHNTFWSQSSGQPDHRNIMHLKECLSWVPT